MMANTVIRTPGQTTTAANSSTPNTAASSGQAGQASGVLPDVQVQWPTLYDFLGISQISWQDIGIRAMLIILAIILIIAVAYEALKGPAVEVTETAARVGAEAG